jgi:hypothetical protein
MTGERARAYGQVTRTLGDLGRATLLPTEQTRIREAADAMVFSGDLGTDRAARTAFSGVCELAEHLVSTNRWSARRAERLIEDIWSCGPGAEDWLAIAA